MYELKRNELSYDELFHDKRHEILCMKFMEMVDEQQEEIEYLASELTAINEEVQKLVQLPAWYKGHSSKTETLLKAGEMHGRRLIEMKQELCEKLGVISIDFEDEHFAFVEPISVETNIRNVYR